MPDRFRIILAKQVAAELEEISDFIAERSEENASRVIERILHAIEGLKTFPHRTVVPGQSPKTQHPVRSLPVQSWIIFFRVIDEHKVVRVVRVRHGRRRRPRRLD